jgi:hypothetical protein
MGNIRFTAIGHLFSVGVITKQGIGSESLVQRSRQRIGRRTKTNVRIVQTPLQSRAASQLLSFFFFLWASNLQMSCTRFSVARS